MVDDAGRLVHSGAVRTDDEIDAWLRTFAGHVVVAAVDAPLIVPNETGQRRCEATIDALDEVLGPRPGRRSRPQADDERVDRIVASKRVTRPGKTSGARVVITCGACEAFSPDPRKP